VRCSLRDRRGYLLAALCTLLLIPWVAVALPTASFEIAENGSSCQVEIELVGAASYYFSEPGILGEQVPVEVSDVRLVLENGTEEVFEQPARSMIGFPRGNYTLSYRAPVRNYHLQQIFDQYYEVNVTVPSGYDVRNPLLGGWSPGATVTREANGSTRLSWRRTHDLFVRFYDPGRESLLWFFGTSWAVVAIVLLFPFLVGRFARQGRE